MKSITTSDAPAAIGPYAQAVEHNGTLYCSGQIGLDPQTGELKQTVEDQVKQVLENIEAVLSAAGYTKQHVVKCTVFLTDITQFTPVNAQYEAYFSPHKPARSTVEVSALPKGALIEIEVIAMQ